MGTNYSVDSSGNLTTAGSITSTSTTSGFLLPKLTTTQRNAIASPATGLEIFNTTTNQIEFYNGSVWGAIATSGVTGSGSTSTIPKWTSGSAIGNSLLSDNGAGTLGGLTYQQSTSGQSTYYMTFADNSTALSSHEMFHGQVSTFSSAQNIGTMNSFSGNLIIVAGYKTGGTEQCFTDLLIMSAVSSSSAAVVTVVSNNSVNGPTARTYTVSQRSLFMQMSGNASSFNVGVRVVCVE